jgi:hypothetical protein
MLTQGPSAGEQPSTTGLLASADAQGFQTSLILKKLEPSAAPKLQPSTT